MKKNLFGALLIILTCYTAIAHAEMVSRISGEFNQASMRGNQWGALSREGKILFIFTAVRTLKDMGVDLRLTHLEYAELLDQYINNNPQLLSEDIGNIFANMVYSVEPYTKKQLKSISAPKANPWQAGSRPIESYYEELGIEDPAHNKQTKEDYAP
ncbi:MAG: hypothetical protein ACI9CF_000364 [Candidatus Omnitrophota bacterium]|jgi:hypothetical protein